MKNSVFLSAMLVAIACGRNPRVAPQEKGALDLPEYHQTTDGFYLAPTDEVKLSGSMLIWDSNASTDQIFEISSLSDEKKDLQVEYLRLLDEDAKDAVGALNTLDAAIAENKAASNADIAARKAANTEREIGTLLAHTRTLFKKTLDGLQATHGNVDVETSMARFRFYCEGKLWEMAASQALMGYKYTKRPTPSPVCEAIYAGEDTGSPVLLSESSAACGQDARGKSFVECFWREGVFKTATWAALFDGQPNTDTFKNWVLSGDFARFLAEASDTTLNKLNRFLVNGKLTLKSSDGGPALAIRRKKGAKLPLLGGRMLFKAPLVYVDSSSSIHAKDKNRLFAGYGAISTIDEAELATLNELQRIIGLLGKRDKTPVVGASDVIYNQHLATEEIVTGETSEGTGDARGDAKSRRDAGQELDQLVFGSKNSTNVEPAPEFIEREKQLEAEIKQARLDVKDVGKRFLELEDRLFSSLNQDSLHAVNSQGAALMLQSLEFSAKGDNENGLIRVSIKGFGDDAGPAVGCVVAATGKQTECIDKTSGESDKMPLEGVTVEMEPGTGKISLSLPAQDPEALGFNFLPKNEDKANPSNAFCLIHPEEVEKHSIEIELYPTNVSGIPYLSGGVKVVKDDESSFVGSVSFNGFDDFRKPQVEIAEKLTKQYLALTSQ